MVIEEDDGDETLASEEKTGTGTAVVRPAHQRVSGQAEADKVQARGEMRHEHRRGEEVPTEVANATTQTGIPMPELSSTAPLPAVPADTQTAVAFQWWRSWWAIMTLGVIIGAVGGYGLVGLFTIERQVATTEPLEITPAPVKLVVISLTTDDERLVLSPTTTPTLAEVKQAASITVECALPPLIAGGEEGDVSAEIEPIIRNATAARRWLAPRPRPKLRVVAPPPTLPESPSASAPPAAPPCVDKTGTALFSCCQFITERLINYEDEYRNCTSNPQYRPPLAGGERR